MILKELLEDQFYLKLGILGFYNLIVGMILYLIISDYFSIRQSTKDIEEFVMKGCSDYQTNLLLKYVLISLSEIEKLYTLTIIFYISMFLLSILKICMTYYKQYKRKMNEILLEQNTNNMIELAFLM
jgi:hypothetical protein